jgi:hypothetical protein
MTEHIQIGDVSPRIQYAATGSQTAFTYPFPVFADTDLEVYVDDDPKIIAVDYAVAGAGNSSGGTVTFATAPADGAVVTLRRKLAVQRTTDFQESGDFRAKTINDELDREVAFIQQVADGVGRSIRLSDADVPASLTLPAKAARAGKALGFDGNGNVTLSSHDLSQIETDAANAATHAATAATNAAQAVAAAGTAGTAATNAAQSAAEAELYAQQALGGDAKDLKVSADDTTPGYLEDKLLASGLASLATQNGGGDETRTLDVPVASQAEAEAGEDNTKAMTALRTSQAIAALQRAIASQAEAEAGTDNTKDMTPLRVAQAIAALAGGGIAMSTQVFTASGTYTKPSGLLYAWVFVTGGGGGGGLPSGGGWGAGGGGGGTAIKLIAAASLGATETVTVGSAGGGSSSFGSHCSATGGNAGGHSSPGHGGTGTNGNINLDGSKGAVGWPYEHAEIWGTGGTSFWGGGYGRGGHGKDDATARAGVVFILEFKEA